MARSRTSHQWLKEHFQDEYVKRARIDGYRCRAVYKLKEIHEKDQLLKVGQTIVDLGAAPGGWSQFAAEIVGEKGLIIALDLLEMAPIPHVNFIQGDFREETVTAALLEQLANRPVDLVLSDMSPNISGMKAMDQPRGMYLCELAVEFAQQTLRPEGDLLMKVFQGTGFDELLRHLRTQFKRVATRKPQASRSRSPELYLLARNYQPNDRINSESSPVNH